MLIKIPEKSLVMMIGPSCSGKSLFCNTYFKPEDVIETDHFRDLVGGSVADQSNNSEVFKHVYDIIEYRLSKGIFTVLDATNLRHEYRKTVYDIVKKYHSQITAITMDIPKEKLLERRKDWIPEYVIERHYKDFDRSKKFLKQDIKNIYILKDPEYNSDKTSFTINGEEIKIEMETLSPNIHTIPLEPNEGYDVVGDVHGCIQELQELLVDIGYGVIVKGKFKAHQENIRKLIFVGDLVDRGPSSIDVLKLVIDLYNKGMAYCVLGNHDDKFLRAIDKGKVQINDSLQASLDEYFELSSDDQAIIKEFLKNLPHHLVLDGGKLVVSHAGIKEKYIGKDSRRIKEFCLYGDADGSKDQYGFPIRKNWARDYRGSATIVYGHTPHTEVVVENNTYNIDTGCSFGGKLTCLRYPEMKFHSITSKEIYFFRDQKPMNSGFELQAYIPDISDYQKDIYYQDEYISGKVKIRIPENNMRSAIQSTTKYTVDPRWLVYIPPTMSPCETSSEDLYLEYPTEAIGYYKSHGIEEVICERKHMGSRAVVIVCKDNYVAKRVFHITNDNEIGVIYTRKGKRFFNDNLELESILLERLRQNLMKNKFFKNFNTDWVILDCELMPWSNKAQGLIRNHYATVGRIGRDNLGLAAKIFSELGESEKYDSETNHEIIKLAEKFSFRQSELERYTKSYRDYCEHVESIDDIKIAAFHVLAYEGHLNTREDTEHLKDHIQVINNYVVDDRNYISTPYIMVNTEDEDSIKEAIIWWKEATENGYEGMVVKPSTYLAYSNKNNGELIQPAIKCRGREYLRIIYGPEYISDLNRLKKRSLSAKRNLALTEYMLGLNSLYHLVNNGPFYKIHQASLGVLANEYEPVDVRL